jgi:hypothetical protein
MTARAIAGVAMVVVIGAAVAAGVRMMGSPGEARERRMDARRVDDLRVIAGSVETYRTRRGDLPASIEALETGLAVTIGHVDPETGAPYEYRVLAPDRYELCAVFATALAPEAPYADQSWIHGAGRACFERAG